PIIGPRRVGAERSSTKSEHRCNFPNARFGCSRNRNRCSSLRCLKSPPAPSESKADGGTQATSNATTTSCAPATARTYGYIAISHGTGSGICMDFGADAPVDGRRLTVDGQNRNRKSEDREQMNTSSDRKLSALNHHPSSFSDRQLST